MAETADKTSIVASETFKGKLRAADEAPPAIIVLVRHVQSTLRLPNDLACHTSTTLLHSCTLHIYRFA